MDKTSRKKEADSHRMRDWIVVILEFMIEVEPDSTALRDLRKATHDVYSDSDVRGLKSIAGELPNLFKILSPANRAELDRRLHDLFGYGLEAESRRRQKRIGRILKQGAIESEEDYRLLEERVEGICEKEPLKDEAEDLNALLLAFHEKGTGKP